MAIWGMGPLGAGVHAAKITIWALTGSGYQEVQDTLAGRFMAEHPDVEVEVEYHLYTEIRDKALVGMAAGLHPDIIMLPTRDAPAFIDHGLVVPVDHRALGLSSPEEIGDLFIPGVAKALQYNGEFYFLPTEFTSLALYYNKDMLALRGLSNDAPETWDQVKGLGRKLTEEGPDGPNQVGVSFLRWGTYNVFWYMSFIRSAGEDWLVDGTPGFARPNSVRAIEDYVGFFTDGVANDLVGIDQFPAGRVGFAPGITGAIHDFRENELPFELGVAPYPYLEWGDPANIAYSWGYYVTSSSDAPQVAWQVADWFTSEENAPFWYEVAKLFIPRGRGWIHDITRDDPALQVLLLETSRASTMELAHPKYAEIEQAIVLSQSQIIDDGMNVTSSLIGLDDRIQAILSEP